MRLTIAKRLVPVTVAAIIGVTLMAGVGLTMNDRIYDSTNNANKSVIPALLLLDDIRKNFLLARALAYRAIFSPDNSNTEILSGKLSEYRQKIEEAVDKYEFNGCSDASCITDDTEKKYHYQEKVLLSEFNNTLAQAMTEARNGQIGRAQSVLLESGDAADKLQIIIEQHQRYNVIAGNRIAQQAVDEKKQAFYLLLSFGFSTLIFIGILGYLSIKSIINQLGGEPEDAAAIATKMTQGDLTSQINLRPGDTTSLMAKIQQLVHNMENVANRADAISRGNLADEVQVLSEKDRLGQAINHMMVALRTARLLDDRRNWLNNGNNQLSIALTGDYTTQQIADIAMRTIGHYLNAGRGVFYILRKDVAILDLVSSYMYTEDINYRKSFRVGEGAIGQVAMEQAPIILASVNSSSAFITTGTAHYLPVSTYTYPVLKEKMLLGVIEFSSLEHFSETKLDYFCSAIDIIASYLYVAEQRGQIHALLASSEQAERDVRKQNEYLQEINSRMEEQQQQLQQQSEELQQTNAQMEEQHQLLEQNNEKLRLSEADINEKARQLELSNHYKSEFLANMSHELRTPLNAIILLSKMMLDNPDGNLSEKEIKRAEVIHHSGHDLLMIINEVLDLSKVDAGKMEIIVDEVSTKTLILEQLDLFESTAQKNGIDFHINDEFKGKFKSDQTKINQILRNLLSNAFKFTKQGSVTLTIRKLDNDPLPIRILVSDTGIGIPSSKHKAVFEAFRQVDGSTSREFGGTGLGLTISLRFAELLGGKIRLASTEGKGSEFTLCLPDLPPQSEGDTALHPRSDSQAESLQQKSELAVGSATATLPQDQQNEVADDRHNLKPQDKVILLIDDDPHLGSAVVEINHRLGYKTIVADTGTDGLAYAARYHPAGILLDLGLPDKDGIDVLHELKSDSKLSSIPVYIISGRDHDAALNQQDIVGYLQKPIVGSQIEQAEAALINALNQASSNAVLVVTDGMNDNPEIITLLKSTQLQNDIHIVAAGEKLRDAFDLREWGVIIIDLIHLSIDAGLKTAEFVREHAARTAILFFGNEHMVDSDEAKLRIYTDSIIINAPQAGQRLQENIERFLRNESSPTPPHLIPATSTESAGQLLNKRIIVIDDDPRNLFVITAALEQNGASVLNALNGRRALEVLETTAVDLIITDIMMPEMDGYQTIAAIRANPDLSHIPIIALTAKAMADDKKNILEIGADDYLSKPVDYDVLRNMAGLWSSKKHSGS